MPVVPSRLRIEVKLRRVLPEVTAILDEMIRLYNDWEGSSYLKLQSSRPTLQVESPTSSRYELYEKKADLLEAIEHNCPAGCSIIHVS